ncbi:hypothetical protein F2Q68_00027037 [Brassica cretica]|uniref:Uncharacterized protein n=1 Tax=Brassica cretica TaxID=69181 RepID=A0A8S9IGG0_BRACR|nr:hypothetical protein F2Q68_00027037 [Brassica cretica]
MCCNLNSNRESSKEMLLFNDVGLPPELLDLCIGYAVSLDLFDQYPRDGGSYPLCQWLYETYLSSDPPLHLVDLSFDSFRYAYIRFRIVKIRERYLRKKKSLQVKIKRDVREVFVRILPERYDPHPLDLQPLQPIEALLGSGVTSASSMASENGRSGSTCTLIFHGSKYACLIKKILKIVLFNLLKNLDQNNFGLIITTLILTI